MVMARGGVGAGGGRKGVAGGKGRSIIISITKKITYYKYNNG